MHLRDVTSLVRLRRPVLGASARALSRSVTIDDMRDQALRQWPRGVRDYVEGGADGETTLRRNREAYTSISLVPSALRDVSEIDTSTALLGAGSALPIALAPTGFTRMMHADGETAVARAARTRGIPYAVSTFATTRLEDVAAEAGGDLWFQLYVWRDRSLVAELLQRAEASGYRVLMLTVDTPVGGLRARDVRNGFTIPPQLGLSTMLDFALHPLWAARLLRGESITFANLEAAVERSPAGIMAYASSQLDPSVTWDDLAEIRSAWQGPLVLKGLLSASDAVRALDIGADGVVLSNHGGRQLDQVVTPLEMLAEVREAVGHDLQVLVDSGIRRGTDVLTAVAMGADGCMVGRPYLYGLGAAGGPGVERAVQILGDELRRAMQLVGVTSIAEVRKQGTDLLRFPSGAR